MRLKKGSIITLVMKKGVRTNTPFCRVFSFSNQRNHSQIAVIVSKKIASKAVERNKIRRRLQEAIRTILLEISEKIPPLLLVFLGNRSVLEEDFQSLQQEILRVFQKISPKKSLPTDKEK